MRTFDTRAGIDALFVSSFGLGMLYILFDATGQMVIPDSAIPNWTGIVGDVTPVDLLLGSATLFTVGIFVLCVFQGMKRGYP